MTPAKMNSRLHADEQRLAVENRGLVYVIAGDFHASGDEYNELVSRGMLALVESARRYDPSRGVPFGAFARHRIRGAMIRMWSELPRGEADDIERWTTQVACAAPEEEIDPSDPERAIVEQESRGLTRLAVDVLSGT